jgi:hypothetical protein
MRIISSLRVRRSLRSLRRRRSVTALKQAQRARAGAPGALKRSGRDLDTFAEPSALLAQPCASAQEGRSR